MGLVTAGSFRQVISDVEGLGTIRGVEGLRWLIEVVIDLRVGVYIGCDPLTGFQ